MKRNVCLFISVVLSFFIIHSAVVAQNSCNESNFTVVSSTTGNGFSVSPTEFYLASNFSGGVNVNVSNYGENSISVSVQSEVLQGGSGWPVPPTYFTLLGGEEVTISIAVDSGEVLFPDSVFQRVIFHASPIDTSIVVNIYKNRSVGISPVQELSYSLTPNPAMSSVTLNTTTPSGIVDIYNDCGEIVYTKKIESNRMEVSLNGWSSGIYFVKYKYLDTITVKKLVVK